MPALPVPRKAGDALRRGPVTRRSTNFKLTAATDLGEDGATFDGGHAEMLEIDILFLERLVIGGLLAALAVGVAFGPELRRALTRLRHHRVADDRRPMGA